ncbi:MAG: methylated-DNA--[protein]-cysteine S-methyltransferase [Gammaproteobacteria bacterium]|nr:methylated-DNA--[protein]-cysteine S-methyltransferase [Gammaproteobacteria bacterium]
MRLQPNGQFYSYLETPIGTLLLAGDGEALSLLGFPEGKMRRRHESGWHRDDDVFTVARQQLSEYFAGEREVFDIKLAPQGTEFQLAVWQALRKIPYGETWSYGELAASIGKPTASRAVGAANGTNPIPVIIPCHRVIGASGKLTGFGGGLETKERLLEIETNRRAPGLF